jgi:hypothetical protein
MSFCLLVGGAPVAAPVASSHDCHSPLWSGALVRITPGALSLLCAVLLFLAGGRK